MLLSSEELAVASENTVAAALALWLQGRPPEAVSAGQRRQLVGLLRPQHMTGTFLQLLGSCCLGSPYWEVKEGLGIANATLEQEEGARGGEEGGNNKQHAGLKHQEWWCMLQEGEKVGMEAELSARRYAKSCPSLRHSTQQQLGMEEGFNVGSPAVGVKLTVNPVSPAVGVKITVNQASAAVGMEIMVNPTSPAVGVKLTVNPASPAVGVNITVNPVSAAVGVKLTVNPASPAVGVNITVNPVSAAVGVKLTVNPVSAAAEVGLGKSEGDAAGITRAAGCCSSQPSTQRFREELHSKVESWLESAVRPGCDPDPAGEASTSISSCNMPSTISGGQAGGGYAFSTRSGAAAEAAAVAAATACSAAAAAPADDLAAAAAAAAALPAAVAAAAGCAASPVAAVPAAARKQLEDHWFWQQQQGQMEDVCKPQGGMKASSTSTSTHAGSWHTAESSAACCTVDQQEEIQDAADQSSGSSSGRCSSIFKSGRSSSNSSSSNSSRRINQGERGMGNEKLEGDGGWGVSLLEQQQQGSCLGPRLGCARFTGQKMLVANRFCPIWESFAVHLDLVKEGQFSMDVWHLEELGGAQPGCPIYNGLRWRLEVRWEGAQELRGSCCLLRGVGDAVKNGERLGHAIEVNYEGVAEGAAGLVFLDGLAFEVQCLDLAEELACDGVVVPSDVAWVWEALVEDKGEVLGQGLSSEVAGKGGASLTFAKGISRNSNSSSSRFGSNDESGSLADDDWFPPSSNGDDTSLHSSSCSCGSCASVSSSWEEVPWGECNASEDPGGEGNASEDPGGEGNAPEDPGDSEGNASEDPGDSEADEGNSSHSSQADGSSAEGSSTGSDSGNEGSEMESSNDDVGSEDGSESDDSVSSGDGVESSSNSSAIDIDGRLLYLQSYKRPLQRRLVTRLGDAYKKVGSGFPEFQWGEFSMWEEAHGTMEPRLDPRHVKVLRRWSCGAGDGPVIVEDLTSRDVQLEALSSHGAVWLRCFLYCK